MKKTKRILAVGAAICMGISCAFPLVACGKNEVPAEAKDRTVIYYRYGVDNETRDAFKKVIDEYNRGGQGEEDNVWVMGSTFTGSTDANYEGTIANKRKTCQYSIITVDDNQFKSFSAKGYLLSIESRFTDEIKTTINYDAWPEKLANRYRFDEELTASAVNRQGYHLAGKGADLVGLPTNNSVHVLYYNEDVLKTASVNIVSCEENKLGVQYPKLQPHGYAEYLADDDHPAPFDNAVKSKNEAGDDVYKVFNNRIPMNWEETRLFSRLLVNQGGLAPQGGKQKYGYSSEWWFNYGWSVGGDCIGWNADRAEYEFTIVDDSANWLALDNITVGSNSYKPGDVLVHEDAAIINGSAEEKQKLDGKIHELPSMYDATLEFNRMTQPKTAQTATGVYGYGIGQDPDEDRSSGFLSGKNTPLVIESSSEMIGFSTSGINFDIAPACQWREYEGGSTYMSNGAENNYAENSFEKEYLKVIGKEYDGQEYTGEIATAGANNTKLVGRATSAASSRAMVIPKNSDSTKYDAAVKFMAWMAGPEAQSMLASCNKVLANDPAYSMSGEYTNGSARLCKNSWVLGFAMNGGDVGDYDYFNAQTWINNWSTVFNKRVRKGTMKLDDFLSHVPDGSTRTIKEVADSNLAAMNIYLCGR